ncbi:hypothetical protein P43SY_011941 [Pythium insidiosum]|uniref:Uncharacterized protein n=1 Tax=Pythium insidiosum TaxID=114742 RepID=A0AAD5Q138_PYTIN|nr:hypothetical protein P43SY_011941 [Pythium insidiosum]
MKTLDDKHILMVKSHDKSYDIYQTICKKYEGTTASGDPYVIMAFLFNARYEEGKDLTEFLIRYEPAIESLNLALGIVLGASVSSVFLYNAMPKAWENEMRIWRSTRNIIPYEELKANLEAYVTNKLTQERFALARVKAGTTLPANYKLPSLPTGNDNHFSRGYREHPYGRQKASRGRGFGGRNGN